MSTRASDLQTMLRALCAALLALGLLSAPAWAQSDAESRLRDQLRQTALALRQAQQDNDDLRAQLARSKPPVAAPAPAAAAAPRCESDAAALAEARRRAKLCEDRNGGSAARLEEKQAAIEQWKKSYDQAVTLLRSRDADAKRYQAMYEAQQADMRKLRDDNGRLVDIADELLQRYRDKGAWSALRQQEPLTGIGRVDLETLSQRYHARIVDATDAAAADAAAATTP